MRKMRLLAALAVLVAVTAQDCSEGDEQVLMQRRPEPRNWKVPVREYSWSLPGVLWLALLAVESKRDAAVGDQQCEAQDDVDALERLWTRSSSLRGAVLRLGSGVGLAFIFGLALVVTLANSSVALLMDLTQWERSWVPCLHVLTGALIAVTAASESYLRSRSYALAQRVVVAMLGMISNKAKRLQGLDVKDQELVELLEDLREVLMGYIHAAAMPFQVIPVFLWLWMYLGSFAWLIFLGLLRPSLHAPVEAFMAYEAHSQRCWEAAKMQDAELQVSSRRQALEALRKIHESQRFAFCAGRGPQLLALLLTATAWGSAPEVLLVIFLQCQFLLRHLSKLRCMRWGEPTWAKLEAIMRAEEVAEVMKADEGTCLEVSGSFAWKESGEEDPLPSLLNLEVKVVPGEVWVVLGTAGAGKTSLLRAFCGCLTPLKNARISRSESCLFLPSEPRIFPGTLQQNVVCGQTLEPQRFQQVLQACGLGSDTSDLSDDFPAAWHRRIALARAAYAREDLVLMDDPFFGFTKEEVDQFLQVLQGPLFAERSCIFSCSLVPFAALKHPGLRFLFLEAGSCQVVSEPPKHLDNEAFCPRLPLPDTTERPTAPAQSLLGAALAFLARAPGMSLCWFSALLFDQLLQIAIDWWLLCAVLASQIPPRWLAVAALVHISLKLLLPSLGSRSYVRCVGTASVERHMDLALPGEIWALLAGLSCCVGFFSLSLHGVLTPLLALCAWRLVALLAAPRAPRVETRGVALFLGRAAQFLGEEPLAAEERPPRLLYDLGCLLSAAYTVTAMASDATQTQALLTLAPFAILLQFLIAWTDSLRGTALEAAGRFTRSDLKV